MALTCTVLMLPAQLGAASFSESMLERLQAEALVRPTDPLVRAQLAQVLLVRARETGDVAILNHAGQEISAGLKAAPGNYLLEQVQCEYLLYKGDFAAARPLALRLNRKMPDDLESYSLRVRVHLQDGDMEEAEKQAQWMLNLRQDEAITLWRAAEVRERLEDWNGALQFYGEAYRSMKTERELDRAVIRAQAARLQSKIGKAADARKIAQEVRSQFPASPEILALVKDIE
jgi:tetratricopeptide (TPR) repeat protein